MADRTGGETGDGVSGDPGAGSDRWPDLPAVDVTVPDDLAELDEEVGAYRAELTRAPATRRAARSWPGGPGRSSRWAPTRSHPSAPLLLLTVLMIAGFTSMAIVIAPRHSALVSARPLNTAAPGIPGAVGGLLPATTVDGPTGRMDARSIRPGVIALIPASCACSSAITRVFTTASRYRVPLWIVAEPHATAEAAALERGAGNGAAATAVDTTGALTRAVDAQGLTLVFVAADGTIDALVRDAGPATDLQRPLTSIVAGAGAP
ncbi:MAG: hypothetical protein ACYCXA_11750 [Actinomycetes bacterium]